MTTTTNLLHLRFDNYSRYWGVITAVYLLTYLRIPLQLSISIVKAIEIAIVISKASTNTCN